MNLSPEISKKIQEVQALEQNLQSFLMQKQSFQLELNEVLNAIEEIKRSDGEVYKMASGMMIRSNKESMLKELEEKKKLSELRISSIEKQEKLIDDKISAIRKDIDAALSPKKAE